MNKYYLVFLFLLTACPAASDETDRDRDNSSANSSSITTNSSVGSGGFGGFGGSLSSGGQDSIGGGGSSTSTGGQPNILPNGWEYISHHQECSQSNIEIVYNHVNNWTCSPCQCNGCFSNGGELIPEDGINSFGFCRLGIPSDCIVSDSDTECIEDFPIGSLYHKHVTDLRQCSSCDCIQCQIPLGGAPSGSFKNQFPRTICCK